MAVKRGTYRRGQENKIQCLRRNAGKPFASRGCTLPTKPKKSKGKKR